MIKRNLRVGDVFSYRSESLIFSARCTRSEFGRYTEVITNTGNSHWDIGDQITSCDSENHYITILNEQIEPVGFKFQGKNLKQMETTIKRL